MKFGVATLATDFGVSMSELAPLLEDAGFESLWVGDHSHIPAEEATLPPDEDQTGKYYWHTLDQFMALTAAALVTSKLRVGTGICLLTQRDPIYTAKEVATLDHMSQGRAIFGIGGGWNKEELANHGTDFGTRWKLLRERVEAMKAIWTEDTAEYHGDLVDFGPMWACPKPVQSPHPPIYLGGNGPNTLKRVVRYADGWMPDRGDIVARMPELKQLADEAGREEIPVTAFIQPDVGEIERLAEAGIERCMFETPHDTRDVMLKWVDELIEALRPCL